MKLVIAGEPVGKGRPRGRIAGKAKKFVQFYTPTKTKEYEDIIRAECRKHLTDSEPLYDKEVPLVVSIDAYYPIAKSDSKKNKEKKLNNESPCLVKPDIDNVAKIILDGMNGLIFEDDKQIVELNVKKRWSDEPRVEVAVNADASMLQVLAEGSELPF